MAPNPNIQPPIPIAVAVVRQDERVLIGQRPAGVPLAGLWEFPGGKVEPGEAPEQAAARECLEESGIAIEIRGRFPSVEHEYDHARVELLFFDCRPTQATQLPLLPYQWVPIAELGRYQFPTANALLIRLLIEQAA